MHRLLFPLLTGFFLFTSCRNEKKQEDAVLRQPPYDKLTDSIRLDPRNAMHYYKRAVILYDHGQMAYAERDMRMAWKLEPKEDFALSLTTLLKQKNIDSAIVFLEQAEALLPHSIAIQIGLARGYQQKGQTENAISIIDRVLGQFPGQIDALALKSELLGNQDKKEEAIGYLEMAYSLVPSDPEIAYNLAYEYALAKNRKSLSLADSLILAKAPEVEKAYYIKGIYYSRMGNTVVAFQNFDAAIRINYNFNDAYVDKGELLYNLKKYDEALKTFQLALRVDPAIADFYFWTGKILQAMGKKTEAKLNYQRAFALDKNFKAAKDSADKL